MESPLVSIQCLVYNHEPYLRQCLDGFVMQKTNFAFEAIVHDDASTDNSAEIIREYAEKYPDIIKPIYETENQYSKQDGSLDKIMNENTHGKYVAFCEGDDYWIDPLKLQKQVDLLDSDEKYSFCYTKANILYHSQNIISNVGGKPYINYESLLLENPVMTLTTLCRTELLKKYYEDIEPQKYNWSLGDLPMWLYFSSIGTPYFLDEITATYRYLDNSASHSNDKNKVLKFNKSILEIKKLFNNRYNGNSQKILEIITNEYYLRNINFAIQTNDYDFFLENLYNLKKTPGFKKTLFYFKYLVNKRKITNSKAKKYIFLFIKRVIHYNYPK